MVVQIFRVPTVALNDPKFDPKGFWRGDMWPVTTYLVAYGLNRYGYQDEARKLTGKDGRVVCPAMGVNERYNGVTGKATWGAGSGYVVLGLEYDCGKITLGITNDYQTICVPKNAKDDTSNLVSLRSAIRRMIGWKYLRASNEKWKLFFRVLQKIHK